MLLLWKSVEKTLSRKDLEQIEAYVDWARDNIVGTGPDSPKYAGGLLLVGHHNPKLQAKLARLAGSDIRVETYRDLYERAREYYHEVEKRLEATAPEYSRSRRKKPSKGDL